MTDILSCPKCGSQIFRLIAEQIIVGVRGIDDDVVAERTIDVETIISLSCFKCGYFMVDNWGKWAFMTEKRAI